MAARKVQRDLSMPNKDFTCQLCNAAYVNNSGLRDHYNHQHMCLYDMATDRYESLPAEEIARRNQRAADHLKDQIQRGVRDADGNRIPRFARDLGGSPPKKARRFYEENDDGSSSD